MDANNKYMVTIHVDILLYLIFNIVKIKKHCCMIQGEARVIGRKKKRESEREAKQNYQDHKHNGQ